MKRIALVAPGVVAPFTEGRKLLVRDLAVALRARGFEVDMLDGASAESAPAMIRHALRSLAELCAVKSIHAVVAFPFGTFRGLRTLANTWLLRKVRAVCARHAIPSLPLFYSCNGLELEEVGHRFGPALAVGRCSSQVKALHLGIDRLLPTWHGSGGLHQALFLCGYQSPTRKAWHDVLFERGLIDVLRAGSSLATANIGLTVAIPFLREPRMRQRLRREAARSCPQLAIDVRSEEDPVALLAAHDVFVFPYRTDHSIFIPTSLLEALSIGIPTLAADHAMYRALTVADGAPRCALHRVADTVDFAEKLLTLRADYPTAIARVRSSAVAVRRDWNIERCADEVLSALDGLRQ